MFGLDFVPFINIFNRNGDHEVYYIQNNNLFIHMGSIRIIILTMYGIEEF